jgi:hypothetical protein
MAQVHVLPPGLQAAKIYGWNGWSIFLFPPIFEKNQMRSKNIENYMDAIFKFKHLTCTHFTQDLALNMFFAGLNMSDQAGMMQLYSSTAPHGSAARLSL